MTVSRAALLGHQPERIASGLAQVRREPNLGTAADPEEVLQRQETTPPALSSTAPPTPTAAPSPDAGSRPTAPAPTTSSAPPLPDAGPQPAAPPPAPASTSPTAQDEKAKAIIQLANREDASIKDRAEGVVESIIREYYPGERAKVERVSFNDEIARRGLKTESVPKDKTYLGEIFVGTAFLLEAKNRHGFARKVLQVGHELEHIDQYRAGKTGGALKDEREFLAYYHEALAVEKPHTGRVPHLTRIDLVDAAIGYFYCAAPEPTDTDEATKKRKEAFKAEHGAKLGELLEKRSYEIKTLERTSPDDLGKVRPVPTSCKRQS